MGRAGAADRHAITTTLSSGLRSASSSAAGWVTCCSTTRLISSQHPSEIVQLWKGGMSFHGGFLGCVLAVMLFARHRGIPWLSLGDITCAVAPIGLFLGRSPISSMPNCGAAPTDVPWAVVFPGAGPLPRHPSQLYEAMLEGLVLFVVLGAADAGRRAAAARHHHRRLRARLRRSRASSASSSASPMRSLDFYGAGSPWACCCRCR